MYRANFQLLPSVYKAFFSTHKSKHGLRNACKFVVQKVRQETKSVVGLKYRTVLTCYKCYECVVRFRISKTRYVEGIQGMHTVQVQYNF